MKKNLKLIPLILITIAVALTPLEVKALNGSEFKAKVNHDNKYKSWQQHCQNRGVI